MLGRYYSDIYVKVLFKKQYELLETWNHRVTENGKTKFVWDFKI